MVLKYLAKRPLFWLKIYLIQILTWFTCKKLFSKLYIEISGNVIEDDTKVRGSIVATLITLRTCGICKTGSMVQSLVFRFHNQAAFATPSACTYSKLEVAKSFSYCDWLHSTVFVGGMNWQQKIQNKWNKNNAIVAFFCFILKGASTDVYNKKLTVLAFHTNSDCLCKATFSFFSNTPSRREATNI